MSSTLGRSTEGGLLDPGLLSQVVDQAGVGIVAIDAAGVVRICNPEAERQLGATVGQPFHLAPGREARDPDDRPVPEEALPLARALRGEIQPCFKLRIRHPDGDVRTIAGSAMPLHDPEGNVTGAALYTRDATDEREVLAERLHQSEERMRRMFASPMTGVLLTELDGRVLDANDAFLDLIGYTREELERGLDWKRLTPPEWQAASARAVAEVRERGFVAPFEKAYVRKDGTRVSVLIATTHIPEQGLNITFVLDISERKQVEDALRQQTQLIQSITDNASLGLVLMDGRQHCTFMNPAAEQLLGFTMEEVRALDRPLHDIVHHQHPDGTPFPIDDCPIDRALPERMHERGETMFVRPDGSFYPVGFVASPIVRDGASVGTVIEVRDLTADNAAARERERLLSEVRASEDRFRALVDNLPELAFSCDADGRVDLYNSRWMEYTGVERARLHSDGWSTFHHPDHLPRVVETWADCLATGSAFELEFPLRGGDGTYRWFLGRVQPLRDGEGRIVKWFGSMTDIDEAKRAAAELEKLATIIEQSSDCVGTATLDGRTTFLNEAGKRMLGVDDFEGIHISEFVMPEDREMFQQEILPVLLREGRWQSEWRLRKPLTGEAVPVDYNVFVTRHPGTREPLGIATVTRDITEKKKIERKLQEQADSLAILNRVGKQLSSELELEKLVDTVVEASTKLAGAQFGAFFYTVTGPEGNQFTLYSLYGAPREAFSKFPHPRATALFGPTFAGEAVVRIHDVHQDPRYGKNAPHHGMPAGHLPVRSYLAVPVISRTGGVIGGLFFGHADTGVFTERAEELVLGIAAQAAIAMDNAALYQREQRAAAAARQERNRLLHLFGEMPAGVAVSWGPEHRFAWGNEIYTRIVGRRVDGKTVREAFPELADQPFFDMLDHVYRSGTPVYGKEMIVPLDRRGDGVIEETLFDFVYQPIVDVDGKVEGILTFCMEVTEQVRARQRVEALAADLRRSEERFRAVAETIPQMVFTITPDGALDFVNQRLVDFFGRPTESILARGWVEEIHPDDREQALSRWSDSLTSGAAYELEYRVRRSDGVYRWQLSRTLAVRDEGGRVSRWFGTLTDITEQKRIVQERDGLISALERSNRELDQFAYVASHDLKAPLRGIANLSQWIEEDLAGSMTEETRSQMALLRGRVQRLEDLINGILQYSRAGRVRERPERVDVGRMIAEVRDLLAPPASVVLEVDEALPTLVTERVPLQQVFLNLVANALKYGPGPDTRIEVSARDAGAFCEFAVRDNGPGIAPEFHERIWGIFQTLAARDRVEGTGIGLSVVRKIVENKGGRAWVESEPGHGATFRFTWPKHEES